MGLIVALQHVGSWFHCQGQNPRPLHSKAHSEALDNQGNPGWLIFMWLVTSLWIDLLWLGGGSLKGCFLCAFPPTPYEYQELQLNLNLIPELHLMNWLFFSIWTGLSMHSPGWWQVTDQDFSPWEPRSQQKPL